MSELKVNKISPRTNCGTVTLGDSGDTITIPSGVTITNNGTQTGFGRTGAVNWDTTPKTANFTAVSGTGYFVNTTSSSITMTMPSGSAGAIVSIQDYNNTFDSNALVVAPASGEKINGGPASGLLLVTTEGQGITFVYVDSTVGWKTVHENEFTAGGSIDLLATGGTITTCGNYKIHTFTGPGTFCVSQVSGTAANNVVSYMVIAGGGGGGENRGGGGGAGGFREYKSPVDCYSASPLNGNPGGTSITVTATGYPITVGAGGAGTCNSCVNSSSGSNSVFSTVTSTGGGFGGSKNAPAQSGEPGGSGGGGQGSDGTGSGAGNGNTPPVSPAQGSNGGSGDGTSNGSGAGGGGATAVGSNGSFPNGGAGGTGATTSISGSAVQRAGGGGGSGWTGSGGSATGGGGAGVQTTPAVATNDGTANTGGGGGAGPASGPSCKAGSGGSGIVIIRYKYQ